MEIQCGLGIVLYDKPNNTPIDEIWPAGLVVLFCGMPLMIVLFSNGFGLLPSAVLGLLVCLFVALTLSSEDYPAFRIVRAFIGAILAAWLSLNASFSFPVSFGIIGFSLLVGYFAHKLYEFLIYIIIEVLTFIT